MTVGELFAIVKSFIAENWYFIAIIGFLIVLFIDIFKNKKKIVVNTELVDSIKTAILAMIPRIIKVAEENFGAGNGEKKKIAVVTAVVDNITKLFDISTEDVYSKYSKLIYDFVEEVLSTPEKHN